MVLFNMFPSLLLFLEISFWIWEFGQGQLLLVPYYLAFLAASAMVVNFFHFQMLELRCLYVLGSFSRDSAAVSRCWSHDAFTFSAASAVIVNFFHFQMLESRCLYFLGSFRCGTAVHPKLFPGIFWIHPMTVVSESSVNLATFLTELNFQKDRGQEAQEVCSVLGTAQSIPRVIEEPLF